MEQHKDGLGLFQVKPEEYGPKYGEQLMEQYKLYVEMADRVSERRSTANTFFLTANTLLVSIFGAIVGKDAALSSDSINIWFLLFALSGLAFSLAWFFIVKSYRQLNSSKFKIIEEMEKNLPLAPYRAEWIALGKGENPKLYRSLTDIEKFAPFTFSAIYIILLSINIYKLIPKPS